MCCSFWTWAHVVYPHETVKLVLYLLECQVFQRIHCECSGSLRVIGGGGVRTALKGGFFVSSGQNYHHEISAVLE